MGRPYNLQMSILKVARMGHPVLREPARPLDKAALRDPLVQKLIDDMSEGWDPAEYHDTFRDDIMALVDKKVRAGKTEEISEVEEDTAPHRSADILDLSDLLKRSLGRGKGKPASRAAKEEEDEVVEAPVKRAAPRRKAQTATRRATSGDGPKNAPPRKRRAA